MNDITDPDNRSDAATHATAAPATLADALAEVAHWHDLTPARRGELRDALLAVRKIVGLPPEAVPLDCATLSKAVAGQGAHPHGISRKRHANILSGLRAVLRRLGIDHTVPNAAPVLSPAWADLWTKTPAGPSRYRLTRFFTYCSNRNIPPDAVDEAILEGFVDNLLSHAIIARPQQLGGRVASEWNALARTSGGSIRRLTWRRTRKHYALSLTRFPLSFQKSVEQFRIRISPRDPADLFDESETGTGEAPRYATRVVRASTANLRIQQILLAASALVHSGRAPQTLHSLSDLVESEETVKTILRFYWKRGSGKPSSFIGGIAEVLRQIAKHHHSGDEPLMTRISQFRDRVTPNHQGMCPRVRERLRRLIEQPTRAMLLHLPAELMRRAATSSDALEKRRMAQCAVALQILLVCPLRLSNLTGLRLDRHLRRELTGQRRITHVVFAAEEVKNAEPIEWPFSPQTAQMIECWIKSYRSCGVSDGAVWLFPGAAGNNLSNDAMRRVLSGEIERVIGVRIHPHLLRHFAAWLFLKYHPGAYEAVRRILGHRSLTTTLAFYTGLEADAAAKRLDDVLLAELRGTRLVAAQGYNTRRRGTSRDRNGA